LRTIARTAPSTAGGPKRGRYQRYGHCQYTGLDFYRSQSRTDREFEPRRGRCDFTDCLIV
jgi:hypothetical protein